MCHEAAAAAAVGYVRGCTAARLQHGGTDAQKDATRAGQSLKMLREEEFSRRQQSSKQHKGFFNSSLFPPLQRNERHRLAGLCAAAADLPT